MPLNLTSNEHINLAMRMRDDHFCVGHNTNKYTISIDKALEVVKWFEQQPEIVREEQQLSTVQAAFESACVAASPCGHYHCTRNSGHEGDHFVGATLETAHLVWPQSEERKTTALVVDRESKLVEKITTPVVAASEVGEHEVVEICGGGKRLKLNEEVNERVDEQGLFWIKTTQGVWFREDGAIYMPKSNEPPAETQPVADGIPQSRREEIAATINKAMHNG